ncbi:MAG: hypothetical protein DRO88_04840 [Promethearchaeia archaeon]|nr:MAG: hypothetical protein DRO88_04840 [Candidatus Lokiarchaeia archaeon]
MPNPPQQHSPPSVSMSLKQSWKMFIENYKAFLLTEAFALIALFLLVFGFISIIFAIISLIPNITISEFGSQLRQTLVLSLIFRISLSFIFGIIFMGFMNSQFGLANDIINSGDMFAQFKGSFHYLKMHWGKFYLLTIWFNAITWLFSSPFLGFSNSHPHPSAFTVWHWVIFAIRIIIQFLWFLMWIHAFPSLVYQNSLLTALKESFLIFKTEFRRIVKTWGVFFLLFTLPILLLSFFLLIFPDPAISTSLVPIIALVVILLLFLLGFPLMTLLATGIYNNSDIITQTQNHTQIGAKSTQLSEKTPIHPKDDKKPSSQ